MILNMALHMLNWFVAKVLGLWAFAWVTVGFWKTAIAVAQVALPLGLLLLGFYLWDRKRQRDFAEMLTMREAGNAQG